MSAQPIHLHTRPVYALADDVLGALSRLEAELPKDVGDHIAIAQTEAGMRVINAVVAVVEAHLIPGAGMTRDSASPAGCPRQCPAGSGTAPTAGDASCRSDRTD